jgi:hypothetical protein
MKMETKRPPIGLIPKDIHDCYRATDILNAMLRYNKDGYKIPQEWIDEFDDLNKTNIVNGGEF